MPRDPASPLAEEFEPADRARWRALVEKTLKGAGPESLERRTADGLTLRPLVTAEDAAAPVGARKAPAADPTRPWDLRAVVDHPDPAAAGRQALQDLEGGAASLLLRLDPSGADGICAASQDDLVRALDGVLLDLAPVALDAGLLGGQAADWLAVAAKGAPEAALMFHLDPISVLAERGETPGPAESWIVAAAQTAARHAPAYPKASLFLASGRAVHEAGGSDAQELAFALAAAATYAKALHRAGLSMHEAFARQTLGLSADQGYFEQIAKLRAARALWSALTRACGVETPARIEVRSSRRMLSRLDPWTNLLRLTAAGFAAGCGGADAVVLEPFTRPLGRPTDFARRQARNTQLVLMEEAALGRVADPAGGAWWLEILTRDLARAAWSRFQAIEAEGGLVAALESGRLQAEVAEVRAARLRDVARRKAGLIGVSEFPDPAEGAVAVDPVDPTAFAKSAALRLPGPDGRCAALSPMRLAEPFEALRERALALDPAPRAFLATLGRASDHTARVQFTANLLAAGGIAARSGEPGDYAGAEPIAAICSSDERYAEGAVEAARALKAAGAKRLYLAGWPGELEAALREAGVDEFLFAGQDAVDVLGRALECVR